MTWGGCWAGQSELLPHNFLKKLQKGSFDTSKPAKTALGNNFFKSFMANLIVTWWSNVKKGKGYKQVQENPLKAALEVEEEENEAREAKEALPEKEGNDIIYLTQTSFALKLSETEQ